MPLFVLPLVLAAAAAPETVAKDFLTAYLKQPPSVDNFAGARALAPHLSARLRKVLADAESCQADWQRQQPKGSTDKPPFVDCCFFASSPEGLPTSFALATPQALPDGRQRVTVTYTFAEAPGTYEDPNHKLESWSWRDALVLTAEGGGFVVDEFLSERDAPAAPSKLSESFGGCRGAKWIGER